MLPAAPLQVEGCPRSMEEAVPGHQEGLRLISQKDASARRQKRYLVSETSCVCSGTATGGHLPRFGCMLHLSECACTLLYRVQGAA